MQLPEISIRRPVFATVLSLLIVLVGLVSYQRLTVREYPKIDEPNVTVSTTFTGASSEVMESQVTKVLEDSLAGIEGVDVITSISRQELSQITIRFNINRDPDTAAAEVRDKVSRVRGRLPQDINEPVVAKVEADASPVIWLALQSDTLTPLQLSDLANRVAKPRLQTATGAADVRVFGERKYSMRVLLDPQRLSAYGLTAQDVEDALRRANLEVPAGRIESLQREFGVTAATALRTPSEFAAVVVRSSNHQTLRIADVAQVEEAAQDERSSVRFNGQETVSLGVIRQSTANPLELAASVRALMPQVQADFPPGVRLTVANDNTVFIERSIEAVYRTIAEAVLLVALVIFVFLRSLRASLIPLVTIPVSLVGSFALMALFGFSVNTLTLLALVLAIGLVVDDAIVVLENIHRHIEEGLSPWHAALKGGKEIGFAVVAMTLTLAAVYAPLAFTPGRTGRLFAEFALALAGAVLVSGFVALTLSPMMSSLLLRHNPQPGWFDRTMERLLTGVSRLYGAALAWALRHRWVVVSAMGISGLVTAGLFGVVKSELAPMEDRGLIITMVNSPDGATLDYTRRYALAVERMGQQYPEINRLFVSAGNPTVSQAMLFLRTTPWEERTRSTQSIAQDLSPQLSALPGVNAFAVTPPSLGQGSRERPINYVIVTGDDYAGLAKTVRTFQDKLADNPGFVQVDTDLRLNKPELRLEVDRERAAAMDVGVDAVARTVETLVGGRNVTRYQRAGEQYDVVLQSQRSQRDTPADIAQLYVRSNSGAMVPLASLVQVHEVVTPRELNHFGQKRSASITANLAPGYALADALDFMDATAREVLPPGYTTDLNGQSREFRNSSGAMTVVFVLSLAFIFLVLAAQFESFVDPLIILVSVPLSMLGALLALHFTGGTLNVFSQIGLITLVGLISKHGILIVEFANQLRGQGVSLQEAIRQAAELRLRPILMTTGAMVLGALPLAYAHGAGAESRQQMGWVIVGGMSLGTLLTIFVVPTMYTLLARKRTN